MPRGRRAKILTKKEIQILIKQEIAKVLSSSDVKASLVGTKRNGRPPGFKLKKRGSR